MAGLDAAAGIVGLTGFAYHLTRSLYEAGSAFAAARKETKRIARNVNNYANVLDMLNDLIEKDESLMSSKAYNLVGDIINQSYDLFDEIERRLPSSLATREDLKVGEKLKWIFRKSKVGPMIREIESLKTNVAALQGVLCFGGILKAARERATEQQTRQSELDTQKLKVQRLKAENSIVDHLEARSDFFHASGGIESPSETSDDSDESSEAGNQQENHLAVMAVRQQTSLQISIRRNDPLSRFSESLEGVDDASRRQVLLLQNTHGVLQDLVNEWTTLDDGIGVNGSVDTQDSEMPNDGCNTTHNANNLTIPDIQDTSPEQHLSTPTSADLKHAQATGSGYVRSFGTHTSETRAPPPVQRLSLPMLKFQTLAAIFNGQILPECHKLLTNRNVDSVALEKEYRRLRKRIMTRILHKAYKIDVKGDPYLRNVSDSFIAKACRVVVVLDADYRRKSVARVSSEFLTATQESWDITDPWPYRVRGHVDIDSDIEEYLPKHSPKTLQGMRSTHGVMPSRSRQKQQGKIGRLQRDALRMLLDST